jgi:hypothetical protein
MPEQTFEFKKQLFRLWLDGRWREVAVAGNQLLVDYLRDVTHLRHQDRLRWRRVR